MSQTLPSKLIKNAWIWGGVGYLIQNHGDDSFKGVAWRIVGVLSLGYGLKRALVDRDE